MKCLPGFQLSLLRSICLMSWRRQSCCLPAWEFCASGLRASVWHHHKRLWDKLGLLPVGSWPPKRFLVWETKGSRWCKGLGQAMQLWQLSKWLHISRSRVNWSLCVLTVIMASVWDSIYHRIKDWCRLWGALKTIWFQPPIMVRDTFYAAKIAQSPISGLAFNTSKDGAPKTSLGNLCHDLTTLALQTSF